MTDLREAVARLVDPKLFDDHAPHPWPYLLDEDRNAAISVAGDYLRAIEAAGYAIVPKEPLPDMLGAWYRVKNGFHFHGDPPPADTSDRAAYRAMLSAGDLLGDTNGS